VNRSGRGHDPMRPTSLTASLRAAGDHASATYGELTGSYIRTAEGNPADHSLDAIDDLVETLSAASDLAEARGNRQLINELAEAASHAERIRSIAARNRWARPFPGEQLELLRVSYAAQQLTYRLDAAVGLVDDIERLGARTARRRVVVEQTAELPRRSGFSAADLRLPPGAVQPIEVTLPGALIGLAVLLLPPRHRSRYHEEFRAEVRDLPSNEQVGYAIRQCAQALALRAGLMAQAWSGWTGRPDKHNDRRSGDR
jgi:hypothetical protein